MSAPRTPSFGVEPASLQGHHAQIAGQGPLSTAEVRSIDRHFRKRWKALLSVDDAIGGLVHTLEELELLTSTCVLVPSPSRPVPSRLLSLRPVRSPLILSRPISSHPVPSHLLSPRPVPFPLTLSRPISSHPVPPHLPPSPPTLSQLVPSLLIPPHPHPCRYVMMTSDHGYNLGQHNLPACKLQVDKHTPSTRPSPPITSRTIPHHTIPYHTIPYHTIPYHTIP
jgi:hypothetical protein